MQHSRKKENWLYTILIAVVILINIKRIFVDFSIDAEYAITMSYRMVQGDHMFLEMWEPHQTSAFLNALLIKLWLIVTGTTTGLVLYLNIIGVVVKIGVTIFLYQTLQKYCNPQTLFYMSVFFMSSSVKGFVMLEHSNMQLYFSILLFCSLFRFIQNQTKIIWLLLSAVFLCLEILSYPTCIIVFFISVGILCHMTEKKIENTILFTGICILSGIAYLLYFCTRLGIDNFFTCIAQIISGDSSHSTGISEKWGNYGIELLRITQIYLICAVSAFVIAQVIYLLSSGKSRKNKFVPIHRVIATFFALLTIDSFYNLLTYRYEFYFIEIYIPAMLLALSLLQYCSAAEKKAVKIGMAISLGALLATLTLTNSTFFTSLSYMLLGVTLSFIPIFRAIQEIQSNSQKTVSFYSVEAVGVLLVILFRCIYIIIPMSGYYACILDVCNIVKNGPAFGIMSTYIGPYIMNRNMEEWPQYIFPGDNVLLVSGSDGIGILGYLYEDVNICVDSTICTPTFDDKLLLYWELNPDKKPNVVVADCWFGELKLDEDSWIIQWVNEEFGEDSYTDGTYLRFYRK